MSGRNWKSTSLLIFFFFFFGASFYIKLKKIYINNH